jgi:hypothetical protein
VVESQNTKKEKPVKNRASRLYKLEKSPTVTHKTSAILKDDWH